MITDGQRRLLELLDEAISDHGDDGTGCNCLVRGAEIELALRRQTLLEAAVQAP